MDAGDMDTDNAARGIAHFKTIHQRDGRYHWELVNPHGTAMFRSMETFDTEHEAVENAEHARQLIRSAPIKRS